MAEQRMKFLLDIIGGEENLPPQLNPAMTKTDPAVLQTMDDNDDANPPPILRDPCLIPPSQMRADVQPDIPSAPAMAHVDEFGTFALNGDGLQGEPAPPGISFTPFDALSRYCYKFVPRQWMQPLATAFFDQDKIYHRDWTLYYIHCDYSGVIFFVAEHQLHALIAEINSKFPSANLSIGEEELRGHLVIDFEDLPQQYRPRWLGHCNSRAQHKSWMFQMQHEAPTAMSDSDDRSLAAFKTKIDQAREANSKRKKSTKAAKHQETLVRRQDMVRQTLRAQRYLGLLPKNEESLLPGLANLAITTTDPALPPQFSFDNEPVFIAIDVEAWEKPPRMITEIGVATLDTRDLKNIAPGEIGMTWQQYIRGRHFRILEYKTHVNHEYIAGCPDAFEFGESELVGKDSIAPILASCFREPYSKKQCEASPGADQEPRNIIVVGHDLGQDVQYCRQLGFNIFNRGNIIDTMDTLSLYRAYTKGTNPSSLGSILYDFDLRGWNLHNAGNDAVYTMQAMLAICVKMASQRGDDKSGANDKTRYEKHQETLVESGRERAKEDLEGWESTDGDDGGVPLPPSELDFQPKSQAVPRRPKPPPGHSGLYTLMGNPLDV